MKTIEVSDDIRAALQELTTDFQRTPEEVLAALLRIPEGSAESVEPLAGFVIGHPFRALVPDAEKYLALLSWVAGHHAAEFGEFIRLQIGRRRYLSMTREEILETCRHNHARQIDGTQYWAVMNIDTATQRRFLARVLEFIGYRDDVIEFVCRAFGGRIAGRRFRFTALVA